MTEPEQAPPRVTLDRDAIIQAALELARHTPSKKLTVTTLGTALGADPSAMYRHFSNIKDLKLAALDHLLLELAEQSRTLTGTWRERINDHMRKNIELAMHYPAILSEVYHLGPTTRGETASIEFILTALDTSGLPEAEIPKAYALISGFMISQCAGSANSYLLRTVAPATEDTLWFQSGTPITATQHPGISRYEHQLFSLTALEVFQATANALLDIIEAKIPQP